MDPRARHSVSFPISRSHGKSSNALICPSFYLEASSCLWGRSPAASAFGQVSEDERDAASIHVSGSIFDSLYRNGSPENPEHGLQVVLVPAATGAVGEFVVPEPGVYKILDYELTDAAKGVIGRIRAE